MSLNLVHFPDFKRPLFGAKPNHTTYDLLCKLKADLGCQHIAHVFQSPTAQAKGPLAAETSVVVTYPTSWIIRYSMRNYFRIDPLMRMEGQISTVCDLAELAADSPEIADFLHDGEIHGLGNFMVAVPVSHELGYPGNTLLTFDLEPTKRKAFLASNRERWAAAADLVHQTVLQERGLASVPTTAQLTRREVECLRWAAFGKTDGEIADILSIARWTVVTYLQNAKVKLGCPNRTAAVATALVMGIIDLSDPT
jgi:LuxR family transcriptional regulator, quorum-sensing system regulator VjbR